MAARGGSIVGSRTIYARARLYARAAAALAGRTRAARVDASRGNAGGAWTPRWMRAGLDTKGWRARMSRLPG
jgi:hypothetical protein